MEVLHLFMCSLICINDRFNFPIIYATYKEPAVKAYQGSERRLKKGIRIMIIRRSANIMNKLGISRGIFGLQNNTKQNADDQPYVLGNSCRPLLTLGKPKRNTVIMFSAVEKSCHSCSFKLSPTTSRLFSSCLSFSLS